jgi:hypothetical protein
MSLHMWELVVNSVIYRFLFLFLSLLFKLFLFCRESFYRNPSLGLATKARGCKVAGQEGDPRVTSYVPMSAMSVKE